MKINPTTAYRTYRKVAESTHAPRPTETHLEETAYKNGNIDQIQISPEGARKMEVEQLTRAIAADFHEPASPERLESLRTAVQNKTYHIPTGSLADAVMSHWFA